MKKTLIIGIGNAKRGDDSAGILAAEKLAGRGKIGAEIVQCQGEAGELLDLWKDFCEVILIDAVNGTGETGSVFKFNASEDKIPAEMFHGVSTHNFGLAEAVELGRIIGNLPERVIVFGIAGENFNIGSEAGAKVKEGVEKAVEEIMESLKVGK